ncbi:DUF2798 domain-containing protein [Thermoflexibacter ruber]|uniref:DUF2798 domain-containing protein n=1 Tax=Thermoflexibacter ruber TaxID=1003 RepID=A0A1I2J8C4_9BACT|nr:Protein of unknown function [Thermoflexibacter ruber]
MSNEFKRLALFGIIISLLTSTYVSFLGTIFKQGFGTENLVYNWLSLVLKAYIAVLPFVLITGPLVRRLADWIFVKLTSIKKK